MPDSIKNYYDELSSDYDQNRFANSYGRYIDAQERRILDKWIGGKENGLEIACGTGRFLQYADIGVDISEKMLEVARQKYPHKTLLVSDAENIALADESVDFILCFHLFMHLEVEKMQAILAECFRLLKPKGCLIFDVPSADRRNLLSRKSEGWHGNTAYKLSEMQNIVGRKWKIQHSEGILFFPIHRFPTSIRSYFQGIDNFFCQSPLRKFASYQVFSLYKNA